MKFPHSTDFFFFLFLNQAKFWSLNRSLHCYPSNSNKIKWSSSGSVSVGENPKPLWSIADISALQGPSDLITAALTSHTKTCFAHVLCIEEVSASISTETGMGWNLVVNHWHSSRGALSPWGSAAIFSLASFASLWKGYKSRELTWLP